MTEEKRGQIAFHRIAYSPVEIINKRGKSLKLLKINDGGSPGN